MSVALADARLYLVSTGRLAAGYLVDMVPELVEAGVDIIQLREKDLEANDVIWVGEPLGRACKEAGIPFIVNDRPDVALALKADGVHLGRNDLPVKAARRVIGRRAIVGRSTHSVADIETEIETRAQVNYLAVGPVHATPTKPERPGTGLGPVRYAAETLKIPFFVTGAMSEETLPAVLQAGARRIVVVRAITQAPDPVAAVKRLRGMLDEFPL